MMKLYKIELGLAADENGYRQDVSLSCYRDTGDPEKWIVRVDASPSRLEFKMEPKEIDGVIENLVQAKALVQRIVALVQQEVK